MVRGRRLTPRLLVQPFVFARPASYQHYLMSTSYVGRLKKLQRQRAASQ